MRRYACLPCDVIAQGTFALTTVQDAHIESIRLWRNEQIDVLRQSTPISREQQIAYFDTAIWPTLGEAHPANLLLSFLEAGVPIGYGGLVHIAWEHRRAEVSFLLDPTLTRDAAVYSAYFSAYLALIRALAFTRMNLRRLFTETYEFRTDHIRTLEASGFRREGRMRGHIEINGRPVDALIHGVLSDDA